MKKIHGTVTEQNLLKAFAGESQARNRYNLFAERGHKPEFRFITFSTEEYRQRLEDKAFREL